MILRLKNFIDELEQKQQFWYFATVSTIFIFLVGLLFYYHANKISHLQKQLRRINHQRMQARELLEKYTTVKQQKISVDEILSQDKTFKIKEYFSRTLAEMRLQNKLDKEAEVADPQDLDNGYTEIKLDAGFTKMSMQELAELIYQIEKKPQSLHKRTYYN